MRFTGKQRKSSFRFSATIADQEESTCLTAALKVVTTLSEASSFGKELVATNTDFVILPPRQSVDLLSTKYDSVFRSRVINNTSIGTATGVCRTLTHVENSAFAGNGGISPRKSSNDILLQCGGFNRIT